MIFGAVRTVYERGLSATANLYDVVAATIKIYYIIVQSENSSIRFYVTLL